MADPPVMAGGVKEIVADAFPATAISSVGALGTVTGFTDNEEAEATEAPTALVATTENV